MRPAITAVAVLTLLAGCNRGPEYNEVFRYPMSQWETKAEALSDADLSAVYVYGILKRRPPAVLAGPVAKRGGGFVKELVDRLLPQKDDYLLFSTAEVSEQMEHLHPGSVCRDATLAKTLGVVGSYIKNKLLSTRYHERLTALCSTRSARGIIAR